ncbi:OLC1v1009543C1 [Oldenlandia corymbosa var. corymbosa]|uniref:OLC1v1009543C1 n=1 Tax=Oldenlandia corymbosa var. corymbosa TaxID=529605 RepID=A0AAV1DSH9_OLDCO|nr:OLC1v1009543C1 [Oldenlandia corymbosa var. corymbosa]
MRVKENQQGVGSSPEEMDSRTYSTSPVAGRRSNCCHHRWRNCYGTEKSKIGGGLYLPMHNQILRIRDEDSHLGEDMIYQVLNLFDAANEFNFNHKGLSTKVVVMSMSSSKPILPASPLGGGTGRTIANNKFAD